MSATDSIANMEQRSIPHFFERNQDTLLTPVAATDQPLYFTRRGLARGTRKTQTLDSMFSNGDAFVKMRDDSSERMWKMI
jgi:hypothetical protein